MSTYIDCIGTKTGAAVELQAGKWYRMNGGGGGRILVAVLEKNGNEIRGGFSADAQAYPEWKAIDENGFRHDVSAIRMGGQAIGALSGPVDDLPGITAEDVRALEAKRGQSLLQAKRERAEEQKADSEDQASLPGKYPGLIPMSKAGKSSHAAGAANLRRMLAAKFPGTAFRITSKSYSGGCSINADWQDGPETKEIQPILDRFSTRDFDGMQDLETIRKNNFSDVFGGAGYVFGDRHMNEGTRAILEAWAREQWNSGGAGDACSYENLAYRLFAQTGIPAGAVVSAVEPRKGDIPEGVSGPAAGWVMVTA